jgi:hypothetical protein
MQQPNLFVSYPRKHANGYNSEQQIDDESESQENQVNAIMPPLGVRVPGKWVISFQYPTNDKTSKHPGKPLPGGHLLKELKK